MENTASSLTTQPTLTTTATAASPVGTYPITASGAASPNYTIGYVSGTLIVRKARYHAMAMIATETLTAVAANVAVDSGPSQNLAITNLGNGSVATERRRCSPGPGLYHSVHYQLRCLRQTG